MGYTCNIIDKNPCYFFVFITCKENFKRMRSQVFPKYKGSTYAYHGVRMLVFQKISRTNKMNDPLQHQGLHIVCTFAFVDFHISTFSLTDILKES